MDQQQREPEEAPAVDGKTRIVAQTPDLRVVEYVLQSGDTRPWRHHSEVTDRFYCLERLLDVELRAPAQKMLLHPGETCVVSPGIVHRSGAPVGSGETRLRRAYVGLSRRVLAPAPRVRQGSKHQIATVLSPRQRGAGGVGGDC